MDSLPIRILPELQKQFPSVSFEVMDPNEEWDIPKRVFVIDTVVGIKDVMVFYDLAQFSCAARVSVHDFDAYANLQLLRKLGRLEEITIIGVPSEFEEQKALSMISDELKKLLMCA